MRRHPIPFGLKIFVFVWSLVLLVPQLHESFRAQKFIATQASTSANADKLAIHFPNDARILALQLDQDYPASPEVVNETQRLNIRLDRFNGLIQRFPHENWLRARLLTLLMAYAIDMDLDGSQKRPTKRVADAIALQKGLRCALEAQKIEPDNAFFAWMEAIFRFGLGQKEAGINALQKAARGKDYNDYVQHDRRQRLALYTLDHPLLYEEKLEVSYSGLQLHITKMHDVQKAALRMALDAEKRGDDQRAVQIVDAILGATHVFRSHPLTFVGMLVGDSMIHETLEKINATQGFKTSKNEARLLGERRQYGISLARDFAKYANHVGRPDAARRALEYAQAEVPYYSFWNSKWWEDYGLQPPWARVGFQGNWFVVQTAYLSLFFAALWLLDGAYMARWSRKDKELDKNGLPQRGQISLSVNFSVGAMLGFAALAAYFGVGFVYGTVAWVGGLDIGTNETINGLLTNATPYVALISWLLPVVLVLMGSQWRRVTVEQSLPSLLAPMSKRQTWVRRALWWAALLTVALTLSNGRGLWDGTVFQPLVSPLLAGLCFSLALGFELKNGGRFRKRTRFRLEKQRQPYRLLFAMRLAGSSAGVLAVVWSLFCFASALGMWPLRATMNHAIEQRIAVGEIEWMKEQVAQKAKSGEVH